MDLYELMILLFGAEFPSEREENQAWGAVLCHLSQRINAERLQILETHGVDLHKDKVAYERYRILRRALEEVEGHLKVTFYQSLDG